MNDIFTRAVDAARTALGYTLFPTQIDCARALLEGHIVEMQTGEGKTLSALPAAAVLAQTGQGVHVLTANDYLAPARRRVDGPPPIVTSASPSVGSASRAPAKSAAPPTPPTSPTSPPPKRASTICAIAAPSPAPSASSVRSTPR